jgi:hypothetical protein
MSKLAEALDRTRDFLTRYVVFANAEQADAVALWVAHTWVYDQFDVTPYLGIQSPEKRSGKTLLQDCLEDVVREPLATGGASLAAIFRAVNEWHPTLLIDEADAVFNRKSNDNSEDLRGLLNSGYRRGRPYLRIVGDGKKMRVEKFETFSPKCLASIRSLPDTVQDRSIIIGLQRKLVSEKVERFRSRRAQLESLPIREWWESIAAELQLPEHAEVPAALSDRSSDSWEPLLAIADAAGGDWLERARRAALILSGVAEIDDERTEVQLLGDIQTIFIEQSADRVATLTLLDILTGTRFAESGWNEWHRRGLNSHGLSYLLRPFKIRARQMKVDGANVRGFHLEQFADAFARYLPSSVQTAPDRYSATSERESERDGSGVAHHTPVAGKKRNGAEQSVPAPWDDVYRHTCTICGDFIEPEDAFLDVPTMSFMHQACRLQAVSA